MNYDKRPGPDPDSADRPAAEPVAWHALTQAQALQQWATTEHGLSSEEAGRRHLEHGPNQLRQQPPRPWWSRLARQFNNVLILVLVAAGVVTLLLGHLVDTAAIFGVVVVNALIGFIQEGKAEKALDSIRKMLSPKATVKRDGRRFSIPAELVVPGDLVTIESGDRVPADLRLTTARRLRIQEAALTGESEAVDKTTHPVDAQAELGDRSCIAHAGTMVAQGKAEGVVVNIGRNTEIGRISELLATVESVETPLLRKLDRFGRILTVYILILAAATFVLGIWFRDYSMSDMFLVAVGIAVAAIPEGLPAIVSVTLALGVQSMARRNAIVRRLPAVETLGSVTTVFSDKTGTLTRNEMTAQAIALADGEVAIAGVGFVPEGGFSRDDKELRPDDDPLLRRFLTAAVLCNDAGLDQRDGRWAIHGDPTEAALVVAAEKAGWDVADLRHQHARLDSIPFESERQFMATLDQLGGSDGAVIHLKGAPEVILERCTSVAGLPGTSIDLDDWHRKVESLSTRGYRVLALAERPAESQTLDDEHVAGGLLLLGLVGLLDPPREAAIKAVATFRKAGIRVKMVTGDHKLTACAIARQLGLEQTDLAVTGRELETVTDDALRDLVSRIDVFARAAPEQKLRLVKAIQADGEVCAMTGDGVNDAPALKQADIGIAMGIEGTEAAKEAAEMVLADDNFATIAAAVEEGRKIYDNIRKVILFLLPTNGGQSLVILAAVAAGMALPITPVQILWVNMITVVTLALALGFEPAEPDVMERPPRRVDEPILTRFLLWRVVFVSLLLLVAVFAAFVWQQSAGADIEVARTLAVNTLVVGQIFYLFNSRQLASSSLRLDSLLGSRPALIACGAVIVLQLAWTYAPPLQTLFGSAALEPRHWLAAVAAGASLFLIVEAEKAVLRRFARPPRAAARARPVDQSNSG
jgi:magnesium-transporting ATPase (P-type)